MTNRSQGWVDSSLSHPTKSSGRTNRGQGQGNSRMSRSTKSTGRTNCGLARIGSEKPWSRHHGGITSAAPSMATRLVSTSRGRLRSDQPHILGGLSLCEPTPRCRLRSKEHHRHERWPQTQGLAWNTRGRPARSWWTWPAVNPSCLASTRIDSAWDGSISMKTCPPCVVSAAR